MLAIKPGRTKFDPETILARRIGLQDRLRAVFLFRRNETGPGQDHAGALRQKSLALPHHNNGPDDYTSGPFKIIRHGYIRRAC